MAETRIGRTTDASANGGPAAPARHGVWRVLLAVVTIGWAVAGLLLGLVAVLPTPAVGFWPSMVLFLLAVVLGGYSLLLAVFALPGLGLAALARRSGLRRTALVATVLGLGTIVLCLVPVVQGFRTAEREGVSLSLAEYFSLPALDSPVQTVTYARPDGEELQLDIRRPPAAGNDVGPGRRAAVVTVHGGGGIIGSRSEDVLWSAWLAEEGYVVFSIDYRLGQTPLGQEVTADVKCAVGWVRDNAETYGVDPDRIALLGRSAGGVGALLAAYAPDHPALPPSCAAQNTGVAAVAAFYAATDQTGLDEWEPPWWRPSLDDPGEDLTGDRSGNEEEPFLFTSPTSHVDPGDPPTFLVQGGADQSVPPEQAEALADRLAQEDVPQRLLRLPGARHGFDGIWGGWDTQTTRQALHGFLDEFLSADPAPEAPAGARVLASPGTGHGPSPGTGSAWWMRCHQDEAPGHSTSLRPPRSGAAEPDPARSAAQIPCGGMTQQPQRRGSAARVGVLDQRAAAPQYGQTLIDVLPADPVEGCAGAPGGPRGG